MTCIHDLPEGQLKLLVAIAASWLVCNRPPTTPELRRLAIHPCAASFTALTTKGLITMDWRAGRRLRATLRPTEHAWAELLISCSGKAGAA